MKLFTLIIAAAVSLGASAQVQLASHRSVTERKVTSSAIAKSRAPQKNAAVVAKAEHNWPSGEYKSLGTGSMTDEMVTAIYNLRPVTFAVEIQQSVDDPNFYRIVAPYSQNFADAMKTTNNITLTDAEFDKAGVCVLNIDLTDPDNGYMPKSMIGCDWGHGEMYLGLPSGDNGRLILKDGVITAPRRGIAVGDDEGATAQNTGQHFRIVMPGVNPTDYRLELTDAATCLTTRTFSATPVVGNDIAKVKWYVYPDQMEDEMQTLVSYVASNGPEFTPRNAFSYDMDHVNKETIVLVGLDSEGNVVANFWHSYYFVGDESPEDWQDMGIATFTDGVLKTQYNAEDKTVQCLMQQHKDRPGYMRLVNPYADSPYAQDRYFHKDHNHYIYIVADDPEAVYIEESPLGLDFGHGMTRIWSQAGYWLAAGEDFDTVKELELTSPIVDGKISFKDEDLLFSSLGYDNGDWYMAKAGTEITLPKDQGVDGIVSDDATAPVRYFNLQGVEVPATALTPGLYIRLQGTTATKILH